MPWFVSVGLRYVKGLGGWRRAATRSYLKEVHIVKLYILFPLAIFALPLAAQNASTIRPASATEGVFERLQVKNRGRLFLDTPSPRGEHYVYLDDFNLNSGEGLSPEIEVQPGTRGVTTVVHTFTPSRLCSPGSDTSIGTVRLRDAQLALRGIQLRTILDLKQPLEIEVREQGRSRE
jgi:hypothetical protein